MSANDSTSRWHRKGLCECGGTIHANGGIGEGGVEEWGGNCDRCGRGYGEAVDEPPASTVPGSVDVPCPSCGSAVPVRLLQPTHIAAGATIPTAPAPRREDEEALRDLAEYAPLLRRLLSTTVQTLGAGRAPRDLIRLNMGRRRLQELHDKLATLSARPATGGAEKS